ncbi:MAG: hypothetical protein J5493_05260 [Lachnospiraceae bacterium]|nr:hypothetical protein [Lachnospiraceae bacterium]
MKHNLNKILSITALTLGGILAVLTIALLATGSRFSEIFDIGSLFNRTGPDVPYTTEATNPSSTETEPGTAATEPSETAEPTTVPPETEAPEPVLSTVLRVGVSELKGNFNPFMPLCEGDSNVLKLVGLNLLTRDRTGRVIMMATEGEYSYYNGERYLYTGPADISVDYNEENDETSFTLKLKDGIYFSDGVKLTVDDLIFNLYVRLQPNFQGEGSLRSLDIVGLKNYYYNNSMAESITVSDDEVLAELYDPGIDTQNFIRGLIRDTLLKAAEEARRDWASYQTLGYGNSAEEFFFKVYGIDLNYSLIDKDLDQVCEDVIQSYGLDYRNLAEHYAVNENYFDDMVMTYTREILLVRKMNEAGGEKVNYISGIVRLGDYTVKLRVHGKSTQAVNDLFDMVIAPMHYYGDPDAYDYENHKFGFTPGEYEVPAEALEYPLGAGPYIFDYYDGETVYLKKNANYYKTTSDIDTMTIRAYGSNVLDEVTNNELDIVVLKGNRSVYNALRGANSNRQLKGDKLYAEEIYDLGYSYMGINLEKIKVGNDPYSDESESLRKALLTSMSVFRDIAYENYFGQSMTLIQYPVSPFFSLEPQKASDAFVSFPDGRAVYEAGDSELTRYYPCIDAVKEYLLEAGYRFSESMGKFTEAPEGASLRYEVMLCGDQYADHPSYGMLAYAKSVLYQLGITLDIRYVNSEENMLVYLYLGDVDMWSASWKCIGGPNFDLHYASSSSSNLFHIKDETLDDWIASYSELSQSEDYDGATETAWRIMNRVRDLAVELPCYTLVDYLVYNVKTIDVSTLPTGHSLYWTWMDDVAFLDVFPTLQGGN